MGNRKEQYTIGDLAVERAVASNWDGSIVVKSHTLGTAASFWIPGLPFDVDIVGCDSVLDAAITTAPAVLTFEISGVAITSMSLSILHTSSAAGDADTAVAPTGAKRLPAGTPIEVVDAGAAGGTGTAKLAIHYKRVSAVV